MGCLAVFVLHIKNLAIQYCMGALVTVLVYLRLLSPLNYFLGNDKDVSQTSQDFSFSPAQLCWLQGSVTGHHAFGVWLTRGRKPGSLREMGKKKIQLPGPHARAVESKGRGEHLFATSFPVILMLEPLAWHERYTNSLGPVASHICLCGKPEVHFPDGGDRASEAVSLGKL